MLNELDALFYSETIKPTFDYVHIILALYIFGANPKGVGRYKLKEELSVGSGTAKSLINKLNEKINFISVSNEGIRKGHVLTQKGLNYLSKIKQKIPIVKEGDVFTLNEIIIDPKNINPYYCQIKNASNKLTNGVEQRDAAIKVNGIGSTCLEYDGITLIFKDPLGSFSETDRKQMNVSENVQNYFKNLNLEKNDVIVIGFGKDTIKARLAALNAALTLI